MMLKSLNSAWSREDDDFSDSSLPIIDNFFNELQDTHEEFRRSILNDFEEDELQTLMRLSEEVENDLSHMSEFVTFTSIWHGRVLEEMKDTVLVHIVKAQEDEKGFFVKIAKSKLGQSQRAMMKPGVLFDWLFGYRGSDVAQQIWKLEPHRVPKPTPEAIQNMVRRMTMGFEHFYDNQD